MRKLTTVVLAAAFGFAAPALAQRAGEKGAPPAQPAAPPPPADVRPPLCVYHNIYYSKGATICVGTGWAQTCLPDGGWAPLNPDPRSFGNACGDAKSVPPN